MALHSAAPLVSRPAHTQLAQPDIAPDPLPTPASALLAVRLPLRNNLVVAHNTFHHGGPATLTLTLAGLTLTDPAAPADPADELRLQLPYTVLDRIHLAINRWTHAEGSTVELALTATVSGEEVALVTEIDTHDAAGFDPARLETAKLLLLKWQQHHPHLLAHIPPTRALAIPNPGESLACTVPLPPGYDPHDSSTWVAPFVRKRTPPPATVVRAPAAPATPSTPRARKRPRVDRTVDVEAPHTRGHGGVAPEDRNDTDEKGEASTERERTTTAERPPIASSSARVGLNEDDPKPTPAPIPEPDSEEPEQLYSVAGRPLRRATTRVYHRWG